MIDTAQQLVPLLHWPQASQALMQYQPLTALRQLSSALDGQVIAPLELQSPIPRPKTHENAVFCTRLRFISFSLSNGTSSICCAAQLVSLLHQPQASSAELSASDLSHLGYTHNPHTHQIPGPRADRPCCQLCNSQQPQPPKQSSKHTTWNTLQTTCCSCTSAIFPHPQNAPLFVPPCLHCTYCTAASRS
jgi:hypothetical protein